MAYNSGRYDMNGLCIYAHDIINGTRENKRDKTMELTLVHMNEFGRDRFYAEHTDSNEAMILKLMNRKSFTVDQLQACKDFGWEIKIVGAKLGEFLI